VLRALRVDPLHLGDTSRRRRLGEPSRQQVVARVPAGDVDDVPAQPELLDVLEEDDLHRLAHVREKGHLARRFTAAATWIWWRRHAPVIRRERIFPFSEMYRRSCARFL
jgi:hypothetical protein